MCITAMEIITIITSTGTLIALIFTIHQTQIARKSLKQTRESIDQETRNRQISLLPKFEWIIQVDTKLSSWEKELEDESKKLKELYKNKDSREIDTTKKLINDPKDLGLSKYQYENMPNWLSQLWLSGAQYYFNAIALSDYKCLKNTDLIRMRYERCDESVCAITKIRHYINDMVPGVILETPASIENSEFFSKD